MPKIDSPSLQPVGFPLPELAAVRVFPQQIQRAAALLHSIQTEGIPSDRALQHAFRAERQMGKRDRAQLQVLVFFVLRHWRLLDTLLGSQTDTERRSSLQRLGMTLSLADRLDDALAAITGVDASLVGEQLTSPRIGSDYSPAVSLSLTDTDMKRLLSAFGSEAEAVGRALLERAPLDIRVNSRATTREALQAELQSLGIANMQISGLSQGLRLADNTALTALKSFKEGGFEIQDAGSQWIIEACQAETGQSVLDLCAGAGGKTLGLAEAVGETGRVLACDIAAERLARLPERSARAGWRNIECQPADQSVDHGTDPELLRRAPFDRVLIDAPCSGSGTFRRHPELRQATIDLPALCATQKQLLDDGAKLTRPGGLLIYATCSLWNEENEAQIQGFLQRHPDWSLQTLPESITRHISASQGMARIRPDRHGGDGFFFAVLCAPQ